MRGVGNFSYTVVFSAITISLQGEVGRGRRREGGKEGEREEGGRGQGYGRWSEGRGSMEENDDDRNESGRTDVVCEIERPNVYSLAPPKILN